MKLTNNNIDKIQKEWLLRCIEGNKSRMKHEDLKVLNITSIDEIDTQQMKNLTVEQIAYIDLDISSKIKQRK